MLSGLPQKRALDMIVGLLRKDATPGQLVALGTMVESDVRSGLPADESAVFRLRSIEATMGGLFSGSDAVVAPVTTTPSGPPSTPSTPAAKPTRRP